MINTIQAEATNQKAARTAKAPALSKGEGLGVKSVIALGTPCQEL
jgi:hypothetical protein